MPKPIHVHDLMRARLLERAGLSEPKPARYAGWTLEKIIETNTSPEFREKTALCLAMGFFRYGPLRNQKKPTCWNIHRAIKSCAEFLLDGNEAHLLDIANFAEAEWVMKSHPKAHYRPIDRP